MQEPSSSEAALPAAKFPSTFSAELIEHCRQGCVPPEVFADARSLLSAERRWRCVRVNPRCATHVRGVGAEGVLRLEGLSRASPEKALLTVEERELRDHLRTVLASSPCGWQSTTESGGVSSPSSMPTKEHMCAVVPEAILLRLGISGLTGISLASVQSVSWLPSTVFTLPWSFAMGSSCLFRDGTLLAMDAASIAAVVALQPRRGERVLDLCCAPGMKLGLIADAVAHSGVRGDTNRNGLAVGVDVSLSRLFLSRATLKKQQSGAAAHASSTTSPQRTSATSLPVCLFVGDGRSFSLTSAMASMDATPSAKVDPSTGLTARERRALQRRPGSHPKRTRLDEGPLPPSASPLSSSCDGHVVYAPTPARASLDAWQRELQHEQQQRQGMSEAMGETCLFDRVLVDAECSHDGSVAHIHFGEEAEAESVLDECTSPASPPPHKPFIEKGRGLTNEYRMHHLNLGEGGAATSSSPSASSSMFELQSELLYRGYQLLKPGGTLVYATCSYAFTQDELVVRRFLDRVNAPAETSAGTEKVTAVVVPAFSRTYGTSSHPHVAACVQLESTAIEEALQEQLDTHTTDYGVVVADTRRYFPEDVSSQPPALVGSRFWPRTFSCSFLYVAKIWKRADAEVKHDVA